MSPSEQPSPSSDPTPPPGTPTSPTPAPSPLPESAPSPAPTAAPRRRLLDRATLWLRGALAGLPVLPFLVGVVIAFGACSFAGRLASQQPMFENFVRFFSPIQPQRYFYPTASQLITHIRTTVPPGKKLVLVGGASYFRGTGQNPDELWSLELQRQLGKKYAVVNFAIDQADITSFAAVIFEALAREYPDMIYVSNGSASNGTRVDGGNDYRYLFWDAYYKGLLPASVTSNPEVAEIRRRDLRDPAGLELHLGQWLDHYAYASDLWTYIGYKHFFTVWVDEHRFSPFQARHIEREGNDPNLAARQAATRVEAPYIKHSEEFAKGYSKTGFTETAPGKFTPNPEAWSNLERELRGMFPEALRPRIFVVLLRANPFFMQTLTAEERERTEMIYRLGQEAYEHAGYKVVQLRSADFTADDFIDGGHLMASGGAKVARAVAARIEDGETAVEAAVPLNSPRGGAADIAFALPNDHSPRLEPLVGVMGAGGIELMSLAYLGGENIRLVYQPSPKAPPIFSPAFPASLATGIHTIRVSFSGLYPRTAAETSGLFTPEELTTLKSWLLVRLDGRPFWEAPVTPTDAPAGSIIIGQNPTVPQERFTGTFYLAERRPLAARPLHRTETAGLRVRVTLSKDLANRALPLLTTGKSGAGDVLFLRVTDKGNITLGYDHWGSPLLLSPEIPFGFGTERTLEIRVPALAPTGAEINVTIDGKPTWLQPAPVYRPAPENIYPGKNPIGATSSEATFPTALFDSAIIPTWRG